MEQNLLLIDNLPEDVLPSGREFAFGVRSGNANGTMVRDWVGSHSNDDDEGFSDTNYCAKKLNSKLGSGSQQRNSLNDEACLMEVFIYRRLEPIDRQDGLVSIGYFLVILKADNKKRAVSSIIGSQYDKYDGVRIKPIKTVSSVEWHRKGNYISAIMPAEIPFKLTSSDNYSPWRRSMVIDLNAKNKMKIVNEDFVEPNITSPIRALWERNNDMIISWILNTVVDQIGNNLNFINSVNKLCLLSQTEGTVG
ncbi:cysteine-rich receptor-like protein kinase 8 [Tanacetum coccineum]